MSVIIDVQGLSKKFRIPVTRTDSSHFRTLRGSLATAVQRLWNRSGQDEDFWALSNVTFQVSRGERIGIIGANGAGKSTLLKILSRITEPTAGRVSIRGTVCGLLEVGSGFHPELTGRENIFLNGAVLGMKRREIMARFDEIVEFAGVEKLLEMPVKHYSSGQFLRLGFSVAAFLRPDVLIIDEILALGDLEFQRKSFLKVESLASDRHVTTLLVSHDLRAIQRLCDRVLILENGELVFNGSPPEALARYTRGQAIKLSEGSPVRQGADLGRVTTVEFRSKTLEPITRIQRGEKLNLRIGFMLRSAIPKFTVTLVVMHWNGVALFSETMAEQAPPELLASGAYELTFELDTKQFKPEAYFLSVHLQDFTTGGSFNVMEGVSFPEVYDPAEDVLLSSRRLGLARVDVAWGSIRRDH